MDLDIDSVQQYFEEVWDGVVSYFSDLDIIHIVAWSCLALGIILLVVGLFLWP